MERLVSQSTNLFWKIWRGGAYDLSPESGWNIPLPFDVLVNIIHHKISSGVEIDWGKHQNTPAHSIPYGNLWKLKKESIFPALYQTLVAHSCPAYLHGLRAALKCMSKVSRAGALLLKAALLISSC